LLLSVSTLDNEKPSLKVEASLIHINFSKEKDIFDVLVITISDLKNN